MCRAWTFAAGVTLASGACLVPVDDASGRSGADAGRVMESRVSSEPADAGVSGTSGAADGGSSADASLVVASDAGSPGSSTCPAPAATCGAERRTLLLDGNPAAKLEVTRAIDTRVLVLYGYQGSGYPADAAGRIRAVRASGMTYEEILCACSAEPGLVLPAAGATLTAAQDRANMDLAAACSYALCTVKPYWIPQLVDDVDVCGELAGAGFRLPTEDDLAAMTATDRTKAAAEGQPASFGTACFAATEVFVRSRLGALAMGDLATGAVIPLCAAGNGCDPRFHFEGGALLRCVRRA